MNTLTTTVFCLGLFVSGTYASCDTSACTGATSTTCTTLNAYITCAAAVETTCTETVDKGLITAALTAARASATVQGCSGARMATISTASLVLALIASFFKA